MSPILISGSRMKTLSVNQRNHLAQFCGNFVLPGLLVEPTYQRKEKEICIPRASSQGGNFGGNFDDNACVIGTLPNFRFDLIIGSQKTLAFQAKEVYNVSVTLNT